MKSIKFLSLVIALLLISTGIYAQVDSVIAKVGQPLITAAEAKYAWVAGVLALIVLIDHLLAANPKIAANSFFQLFTRGLKDVDPNAK